MRNFIFILFVCSSVLLSGCSPLGVLNATVSSDGYKSTLNQAYGKQPRQRLDIHVPNQVSENADVVVFYYGGRWQSGNKEQYTFVADALTSKGIITVLPDYRLYPDVDWGDFIQDGASAYQWVFENIAKYNGNPKRVFVMGHSAGAHISAMVAVDESLLDNGVKRPCGFMGLAGPYDFLPIRDADVIQVFSSAKDLKKTQPITFVNKNDPAMLLMHGKNDVSVQVGNSIRVAEHAERLGGSVATKLYDDVNHVDILISLSSTFRHVSPVLNDSVAFMQNVDCH